MNRQKNVEISNPDKVFFPDNGITKQEMIHYYRKIAETLLPYLKNRPVNMKRFPDGIQAEGFIQQKAGNYFPDWIRRAEMEKQGGKINHVLCEFPETLVYLANQGTVSFHAWLSRKDQPDHPDLLVFDLDPFNNNFHPVKKAAKILKTILTESGLNPFVKTTGSQGLHVVCPLDAKADFDAVREFAGKVSEITANACPDFLTTEQRIKKRNGRLYLDITRNAYGQTIAAPYSLRAKPGAPVSTPIEWEELDKPGMGPRTYTMKNIFRRLGQKKDPWASLFDHPGGVASARDKLLRGS